MARTFYMQKWPKENILVGTIFITYSLIHLSLSFNGLNLGTHYKFTLPATISMGGWQPKTSARAHGMFLNGQAWLDPLACGSWAKPNFGLRARGFLNKNFHPLFEFGISYLNLEQELKIIHEQLVTYTFFFIKIKNKFVK